MKEGRSAREKTRRWLIIAVLHLLQPLARLAGRIRYGLTCFRGNGEEVSHRSIIRYLIPRARQTTIWAEDWRSHIDWLYQIQENLRKQHLTVETSGDFDHWDMEVSTGQLVCTRILTTVEEHGTKEKDEISDQMIRLLLRPRFSDIALLLVLFLFACSFKAAQDGALTAGVVILFFAAVITYRLLIDNARTVAKIMDTVQAIAQQEIEKIKIKRAEKRGGKSSNACRFCRYPCR